ncbi:molecular chaperone GrpE [Acetitomaculum ruminis DSM 5522]|uniref:Protein GrpE n=1 Tax=Acetitomaculum ruminis DSM 5522 TaxID=1120918 RepID=A0A1I0ZG20_9FIRM|nr:nucleotide exchange factor GrpE [Acetitomaculum ruminis]SFB24595.1 molecular chaperone GrpE [Acetitomaculum ruminis DSM 5522]
MEKDVNLEEEIKEETEKETTQETVDENTQTDVEEVEETSKEGEEETKKKKDKKDELIEELNDKVKRQLAEFENFRKRTEKEKSAMYEIGVKSVIEKILPVVDNFERGLVAVPEELKNDSFVDGMDKVYKQLLKSLEEIGVKAIEAEGKEFDPEFHNAVMHIEDDTLGENVVAEELQKGYLYNDTVVRHSMVKVAN